MNVKSEGVAYYKLSEYKEDFMESKYKSLASLKEGEKAKVISILSNPIMKRRFYDIGLIHNSFVECISAPKKGSMGAYLIRKAVIAIRLEDLNNILIEEVSNNER